MKKEREQRNNSPESLETQVVSNGNPSSSDSKWHHVSFLVGHDGLSHRLCAALSPTLPSPPLTQGEITDTAGPAALPSFRYQINHFKKSAIKHHIFT